MADSVDALNLSENTPIRPVIRVHGWRGGAVWEATVLKQLLSKLHFSWQNENAGERNTMVRAMKFPVHGRAWLRFGESVRLGFTWHLWSEFCGLHATTGGEQLAVVSASFPPAAFWLTLGVPWSWREKLVGDKSLDWGWRIHDGAIWWDIGQNSHEWHRSDPRWRHGNFDFVAALLGKFERKIELIAGRDVEIPLPEGAYKAHVSFERVTVRRPRSPFPNSYTAVDVKLDEHPIPFSGKGENSWDCGEDGLYGHYGQADSIEDGIAHVVRSVLRTRQQRGDPARWPTTPAQQDAKRAARQAARSTERVGVSIP